MNSLAGDTANTLPPLENSQSRLQSDVNAFSPRKVLRFQEPDRQKRPSKLPNLHRRASLQAYEPIIVKFVKNGDRFFEGVKLNISQRNMRSWESLLAELSRRIELPAGVRQVYTPEGGRRIKSLSELEHQKTYVCGSMEPFKKINYNNAKNPDWKVPSRVHMSAAPSVFAKQYPLSPFDPNMSLSASVRSDRALNSSMRKWSVGDLNSSSSSGRMQPPVRRRQRSLIRLSSISEPDETLFKSPNHDGPVNQLPLSPHPPASSKPLSLTIYENTPLPRQSIMVYINRDSVKSWEEARQLISENLKTVNGCLHLFKLDGEEVQSLSQLWKAGNALVAAQSRQFDIAMFLRGEGEGMEIILCISMVIATCEIV